MKAAVVFIIFCHPVGVCVAIYTFELTLDEGSKVGLLCIHPLVFVRVCVRPSIVRPSIVLPSARRPLPSASTIFKDFSETAQSMKAKIHREPPWEGGTKV